MITRTEIDKINQFTHNLSGVIDKLTDCSEMWLDLQGIEICDDVLNYKYPFDKSFDEIIGDISNWYFGIQNALSSAIRE